MADSYKGTAYKCNRPLTRIELDLMATGHCQREGCKCGGSLEATGLYFAQECHPGAGFSVQYYKGNLIVECHECERVTAVVSVAKTL